MPARPILLTTSDTDETPRSMTTREVQPSLASTSMKSRPYPPITMAGPIAEHDRPFAIYGQLSMNELFFA